MFWRGRDAEPHGDTRLISAALLIPGGAPSREESACDVCYLLRSRHWPTSRYWPPSKTHLDIGYVSGPCGRGWATTRNCRTCCTPSILVAPGYRKILRVNSRGGTSRGGLDRSCREIPRFISRARDRGRPVPPRFTTRIPAVGTMRVRTVRAWSQCTHSKLAILTDTIRDFFAWSSSALSPMAGFPEQCAIASTVVRLVMDITWVRRSPPA